MNRNSKIKAIVFCVLAAASLASWPARAETIFLKCDQGADWGDKRFITLTIDLTNNTANNLPATINATAIDWQEQTRPLTLSSGVTVSATIYNHVDRITGSYTESVVFHVSSGEHGADPPPRTYPCTVGSAPPTKF